MSEYFLRQAIAHIILFSDGTYYRWWGEVPLWQQRKYMRKVREYKARFPHLWKHLIQDAKGVRLK